MSLVNLSHVCSHLQNASLARLGLTSIPYSRLHLSLGLLLLKQGFISQLKIGGPSPPASCFPPGLRDTLPGHVSPTTPEGALQRMVAHHWSEQQLRDEGYAEEDVEFALAQRMKSREQLDREGWTDVAWEFLVKHAWPRGLAGDADRSDPATLTTPEQLEADGLSPEQIALVREHQPLLAATWSAEQRRKPSADGTPKLIPNTILHLNAKHTYPLSRSTLSHFAGPLNSLRSERDLRRDGISINAMGLSIPNQPYNPPPLPNVPPPSSILKQKQTIFTPTLTDEIEFRGTAEEDRIVRRYGSEVVQTGIEVEQDGIDAKQRDPYAQDGVEGAGIIEGDGTEGDMLSELEFSDPGPAASSPHPSLPPTRGRNPHSPSDLELESHVTLPNRASRRLWLSLKYWDSQPVLRHAKMVSKPTKRFYLSAKEIGDLCRGRGAKGNQVKPLVQVGEVLAVVTVRGVLEARECVERGVGGLVVCRIW